VKALGSISLVALLACAACRTEPVNYDAGQPPPNSAFEEQKYAEPPREPFSHSSTNLDLVSGFPVKITIEPKGKPCIYVEGEVACPAKLEIDEPVTIDQAIGRVGGMTDFASKRRVLVIHPDGKKVIVSRKDFGTFLLKHQDILYVIHPYF
jgi:hypothetical protein